jgi:SRSO17 transposase
VRIKLIKYIFTLIIAISFIGCGNNVSYNVTPKPKPKVKIVKPKPIVKPTIKEPVIQEVIEEVVIEEKTTPSSISIALIFPSKYMSKYGLGASKVISAYFMQQNLNANMQVFDCIDQNYKNVVNTLNKIKEQNITNIIALFTPKMVEYLNTIQDLESLNIYIPTINKKDTNIELTNVTFGGIDYDKQIKKLLTLSNSNIVNFYSKRGISKKLTNILQSNSSNIINKLVDNSSRYNSLLNRSIKYKTMFLNTTMVKSSILLSQIRGKDLKPYRILSTQLNYNPLIISLTQKADRRKLVFANSIGKIDDELEENIALLGADIKYDWVNYSTLIGVDYLVRNTTSIVDLLSYDIEDNQVQYDVNIVKNDGYGFKSYLPVID